MIANMQGSRFICLMCQGGFINSSLFNKNRAAKLDQQDCGAVTTGPVTVPLVLALGAGVSGEQEEEEDEDEVEEKGQAEKGGDETKDGAGGEGVFEEAQCARASPRAGAARPCRSSGRARRCAASSAAPSEVITAIRCAESALHHNPR